MGKGWSERFADVLKPFATLQFAKGYGLVAFTFFLGHFSGMTTLQVSLITFSNPEDQNAFPIRNADVRRGDIRHPASAHGQVRGHRAAGRGRTPRHLRVHRPDTLHRQTTPALLFYHRIGHMFRHRRRIRLLFANGESNAIGESKSGCNLM